MVLRDASWSESEREEKRGVKRASLGLMTGEAQPKRFKEELPFGRDRKRERRSIEKGKRRISRSKKLLRKSKPRVSSEDDGEDYSSGDSASSDSSDDEAWVAEDLLEMSKSMQKRFVEIVPAGQRLKAKAVLELLVEAKLPFISVEATRGEVEDVIEAKVATWSAQVKASLSAKADAGALAQQDFGATIVEMALGMKRLLRFTSKNRASPVQWDFGEFQEILAGLLACSRRLYRSSLEASGQAHLVAPFARAASASDLSIPFAKANGELRKEAAKEALERPVAKAATPLSTQGGQNNVYAANALLRPYNPPNRGRLSTLGAPYSAFRAAGAVTRPWTAPTPRSPLHPLRRAGTIVEGMSAATAAPVIANRV